jgi:hypothetical protein
VNQEILHVENRIQMFCYYNTLAWEILTAALASVIVLGTLPFVVSPAPRCNMLLVIFISCVVLLAGAGFLFRHLRNFGARWISLQEEDDSTSPRAWIDYVEAGDWDPKTHLSPRADETYAIVIISIVLALAYILWTWRFVGLMP